MRGVLFINDRDVTRDLSFVVHSIAGDWPGGLSSSPREVPLIEGPELSGAFLDPRLIRVQAGRATISGRFEIPTLAAARTALDALKAMLGEGEVRIRAIYAPDRECLAVLTGQSGDPFQKRYLNGRLAVSMGFVIKDGVAFRIQPDGYSLTTGRRSCPIGQTEVEPVIFLGGGGSYTNPTITVRNVAGEPVQTMGFTVVLGANDFLRVDSRRAVVDLSVAGSLSDGIGLWTSGDFPVLRPADGWVEGGVYPTVELSGAAGTASGGITYVREYR